MSVVEKFKSASLLCKIHLILLPITLLLHIIGIAIPDWIKYQNVKVGLWKYCQGGTCYKITDSNRDFYKACQAFAIIATLSLIGCLIALFLRVFTDIIKKKILTYGIIATSAVAALSCLITVCVFAGEVTSLERDHLHAGFALVCISLIASVASAILGFLEGRGD